VDVPFATTFEKPPSTQFFQTRYQQHQVVGFCYLHRIIGVVNNVFNCYVEASSRF